MNQPLVYPHLVFTSQPNLVMDSDVRSSLHPNCHHQLVFAKFDLSIYYPPPYERTEWYYNRANADLIQRASDLFDWDKALCINVVEKKVAVFSDTLMNIMQYFMLMKLSYVMTETPRGWIKNKTIEQKNQFYKRFIRSNKTLLYNNQFKRSRTNQASWLKNQKITIIQSCLRSHLIKLLALKLTGQ